MDEDFEFRAVLIKIQHSLSDADRKQLHFLFTDDIRRCLTESSSLTGALDVLQELFNRLKISSNNYDYLVRGLKAIERPDCVERLEEYKKLCKDIVPTQPIEPINQLARITSQSITPEEILNGMYEDDAMSVRTTELLSTGFNPPSPEPMDFTGIDLTPLEDSSSPWTETHSDMLNLKPHPRSYQMEIIRDAIGKQNTIVCLRTGSGKTFIASVLIKYYFIKKQKADPNRKFVALFFVPRKAIRLQQAKAIYSIGNLKVQICEDDQRIDQLIDTNDVIVATPQKFVNCLKAGKVRLSQIDLMIFDECHNTSGGNPYSEIMKFYLCPSKQESITERPIIIGLTATISSKDAVEKKESIEKNLVSLCSRLACRTISTVCDPNHIDEINNQISRPANNQFEFVTKVEYNSYFDQYLQMFDELIEQIKRHLDGRECLDGQEIGSCGFIGQLTLLKQTSERKGEMNNIVICDYLLLLTKRYAALKDLPFDMVIKQILDKIKEYSQGYQKPVPMNNLLYERCQRDLSTLLERHDKNPTTNSKLNHLTTLLKRHASKNTKGLILAQTTFYVKTLYDYLCDHPELSDIVKPTWIVGQNSSDHSLTIHDQEERLKKFQLDACNVLIATDIVQEGLDIPTCSYVIRYEFVSDEIGTIQSRGRARAQNSSYYLISELDSINHRREKNNKFREDYMDMAVEKWPTMNKDSFAHDVTVKSESVIKDWEQALKDEVTRRNALQKVGRKNGSICCRKCSRKLGELEWLKKRNTMYFVNEPEFLDKTECKLRDVYESFQENLVWFFCRFIVSGKVKCTCGNPLGGCQKFLDRQDLGVLCALQCSQVKFLIEGQRTYVEFPQWVKNDRFDVEELEEI